MKRGFILNNIKVVNGTRVEYEYQYDLSIKKFFNKKENFFVEYDVDVSNVPNSILAIPLIANIAPIAWFVGFDICLEELDDTFYQALIVLREEFSNFFPKIKKDAKIQVGKRVENKIIGNESALLFSGGLDSFESLTRHIKPDPYLVSVWGADIEIKDKKKWNDFIQFNKEAEIVNKNKLCYVKSNLRTFYTYELDLLVNLSWWGKIQHGMALISLIAPLSHIYKITTIMIASSNTSEVNFGWGSTSETDEKVRWAN